MATSDYTSEIPYGYCQCGCGQKTRLAPNTNAPAKIFKGEPYRFVKYHAARVRDVGHYKTRRGGYINSNGDIVIVLTKGLEAIVSPEDGDLIEYNWSAHKRNAYYYAARSQGITIHQTVLSRALGRDLKDDDLVDHINGDTLDNRRSNLRLATVAQNNLNCTRRKDNTSGYKGVKKDKRSLKWSARIWANGKRLHLGTFNTPEEAYQAYCDASKLYHGEFGRIQ